ncbi:MAG: histidine kinase [Gemmatimonadaceae bacterium]
MAEASHVPARAVWPLVGAIAVGMLALRLAFAVTELRAQDHAAALVPVVFEEVVGAVVSLPYVWGAIAILRRWPLTRTTPTAWTLRLAAFFAVASALHAPLLFAIRAAAADVLSLEGYAAVPTVAAWVNEAINDILPMLATIAGMTAAEYVLEGRERERRAFALQRSLLEAELRNVRLQLQPHFLFNALNTISATMYEDPAAADALLTGLSELLRASLQSTEAQEVPLRDELALVEQYVRLMQARFPSALRWEVHLEPEAADVLVPSMSLQPIVENAVRHGALATRGHGVVQLTARLVPGDGDGREAASLELCVHDDGPGVQVGRDPLSSGTGLSATVRRIALLHGSSGELEARNAPGGGFDVTLRLPARRGGSPSGGARSGVPATPATAPAGRA